MDYPQNITFEGVESDFVRHAFLRAYQGFGSLQSHPITLRRTAIADTTMRAQPILNRYLWNKSRRHYRIDISNKTKLKHYIPISELPEDVLIGWFAHELGHVVDYQHRTATGLLRFGIGYQLMPTFRIGAERQADIYAIEHGFAAYLLATKNFILEQSSLPNYYKDQIKRYYMSPDEIATLLEQREIDDLKMDKLL